MKLIATQLRISSVTKKYSAFLRYKIDQQHTDNSKYIT